MNCKPGDLAVIVHTHPECEAALGKPIRLTSLSAKEPGCWNYEEMPLRGRWQMGSWTWHEIPDAWLRPIRDPGEDAKDEMLQLVGTPRKEPTTTPEESTA